MTLCFQTICISNSLAQVDFDEKNIANYFSGSVSLNNNNNYQLHGQYWTVSDAFSDEFKLKHFSVNDFDYPPIVMPIGSVYIRPTKILADVSTLEGQEKMSFDGSSHVTGRSIVDGAGYVGKGLTIKGDIDVSRDEKTLKIAMVDR